MADSHELADESMSALTFHRKYLRRIFRTDGSILILLLLTVGALAAGYGAGLRQYRLASGGNAVAPASPHGLLPGSIETYQSLSRIPAAYYDEQLGTTFAQNFTSIAYNVTGIRQTDANGYGPAYLLNGLSSSGYWYQVGVSYDWPIRGGYYSGFAMNYEVFDPFGISIFPASGGGGIEGLTVNPGDIVLLTLNFSAGNVVMQALDLNSNSTAMEMFSDEGANYFVGLPDSFEQNGFFTGLMTEWYHANPHYGDEGEVVYFERNFALSSAWMWADEFDIATGQLIFSNATSSPVTYSQSQNQPQQFSSNGASEASSANAFVTGFSVPPPLTPSATSNSSTVDAGQAVTLACSATGGLPPYSYSWDLYNGTMVQQQVFNYTFSSVGTTNATCTVIDILHDTARASTSVMVYSDPSVSLPLAIASSADVGQTITFETQATGGSGGYTYEWLNLPEECSSYSSSSVSCDPTASGVFEVTVNVTDSNGFMVSSSPLTFLVYSDPSISALTASSITLDLGQETLITIIASGGNGPLSYQFSGLPAGCRNTDTSNLPCNPTATGTYQITANVTDSNGFTTPNAHLSLVVYHDPAISRLVASPMILDLGEQVTFSVSASSGYGTLSYRYDGLPPGCITNNTPMLPCAPLATGTYEIIVDVTDSNNFTVHSSQVSIVVNQDPTTTIGASRSIYDSGQIITLSALVSGGTSPFSYSYEALPSGCASSNSPTLSCTPSIIGNYNVTITVTDSRGETAISSVTIVINPDVSITALAQSLPNVHAGQKVMINVSATGGTKPFSYSFAGLPPGCSTENSPSLTCTPSTSGNYTIKVSVTDLTGDTTTSSLGLTVAPAKAAGLPLSEEYSVVGVTASALIVTAAFAALLLKRRKQSQVSTPASPAFVQDNSNS
jgi:hypothetical protein